MRVSQRLFLAVVPAVVGVFLVAALAYWGEYGRTAPEWLVGVAAVTAVVSLVVTWRNTRFVAERIERLTAALPKDAGSRVQSTLDAVRDVARPRSGSRPDEIDTLASEMERLHSEAASAQQEIRRYEQEAAERVQEYAALLAECATAVERQLEEVRLPLHILLENHFGQLNENQEEMIGAARQAAEAATVELARLEAIAKLDRGALSLRRDLVQVADLIRGIRPSLGAEAERRRVELSWDIAPGLPRVPADRDRLLEALELLLRHIVSHTVSEERVRIGVERVASGVRVEIHHGALSMLGPDVVLARRVIAAHGGTVEFGPTRTAVGLPGQSSSGGGLA